MVCINNSCIMSMAWFLPLFHTNSNIHFSFSSRNE
jgi:hypothetical protein